MKYIHIIFLLLANNGINAMEAECKNLASFFDIDVFIQHDDATKNIAFHCLCDKQWWYLNKEIQFINKNKQLSIERYPNYIKNVCFDNTGTKIIAFASYADCSACMWDSDGRELERLNYDACCRLGENNIEWADKLYNSGNSPWIHNYEEDIKELLAKRFRFGTMLCFHEQQAFVAPQFGVYGGHTVHAWNAIEDKILFTLAHKNIINSVDFNPQGIEIITASADGTMRLWHQKTGKELLCINYDKRRVTSASFNSVGTEIVLATDDGKIKILVKYDTDNIQQVLLKKLLYFWLQLEKPSKEIDSPEKLLDTVAQLLLCNTDELNSTWGSFSKRMQEVIWASMYKKIQGYGK